jgi:hypothetical protein
MFSTYLVAALIFTQSPTEQVLTRVEGTIDKLLKAPRTAKYRITNEIATGEIPAPAILKGRSPFCNREIKDAGFLSIAGTVDASNPLGVMLRAEWKAFFKDKTYELGAVYFDNEPVMMSSAFDAALDLGLKKYATNIYKDFAKIVSLIEKQTEKLPSNNSKRTTQYWGELNRLAERICSSFTITPSELELIFLIGVKNNWETETEADAKACKTMYRRRSREIASNVRKMNAEIGRRQLDAVAGQMERAASAMARSHSNAGDATIQRALSGKSIFGN